MSIRARARGLSLLEVVVFIVVLGVAFTGMLILYNQVTRASVDPIVRKQALAVAQSLLEEIELMPYTYCDPDDANIYTATSAAVGPTGCAATAEGVGTEGGEGRYVNPRFDNVSDYHGFCMGTGAPVCADALITTAAGTAITQLADYRVDVAIAAITAADAIPGVPLDAGLRILVTATHLPTATAVSLIGYRFRYAPNAP
jgi:MSHA pilin protein MshD